MRALRSLRRALPHGGMGHGPVRSLEPSRRTGSVASDSGYGVNDFAFKVGDGQRYRLGQRQRAPPPGSLPDGHSRLRQERLPLQHPGAADLVRDPGQPGRLYRAQSRLPARGRDEPAELRARRRRGRVRRVGAVRQHAGAGRGAAARRRDFPRGPARRNVRGALRGRPHAHPDEEHHVRGRADGAARHRHGRRDDDAPGEVLHEASPDRRQHEGDRARSRLRARALRLSASDPARGRWTPRRTA